MTYRVVYASNGASIGDGIRVVRVSKDGTRLEILTDPVTGRFSEIILKPGEDFAPAFSQSF